MTPEIELLQKEARERMAAHASIKFANDAITAHAVRTGTKGYTGTEYYPELLDALIAKAYLAGEESGKEKAVDYIRETISLADMAPSDLIMLSEILKEAKII